VWEFGMLLLLVAVVAGFVAQRFLPRGPRGGGLLSGTLLVTGVSPRPDAAGEQYVTIAGVINGPTVSEHAVDVQRDTLDSATSLVVSLPGGTGHEASYRRQEHSHLPSRWALLS